TAAPPSPQPPGTTVNLTASVAPTAAVGSVQFQSDAANLGPAVSVTAGTATTSTNSLATGTHSLTAVFTPADPAAFGGSTSQAVPYTINPAPVPFSITTTSLPAGTVNSPYSATLAATGGKSPSTWALATGTLPPGLTLSSAGVVSGTPTAPVTSTFTVRVTDSTTPTAQTANGAFTITVATSSPQTAVKGVTLTNPALGGYWLVASDGGVFGLGNTGFFGSAGSLPLRKPIVGVVATPDRKGYWLVASDGGVFAFGNTGFYGSAASLRLNKPVVGMAATPGGKGYWLVASDGGVFTYGDAGSYGSASGLSLSKPVVGMAATPDGKGYWLVASDGGVFTYGDAGFFGSAASLHLNKPIVGMAGG
ncbi:MAG TPA: Ig-like domain repeat protein, partial [Acidimicrobiia bacterium]|nr:Ig-like domain repeat protein [Acidimicrobiia bacterium]